LCFSRRVVFSFFCLRPKDGEEDKRPSKEDALEKMTVDDFFQGGFEIPEKLAKKSSKSKSKTELGKRKRNVPEEEEEEDDSSSEEDFEEAPVASDSEESEEEGDGVESEDDDESS